MITSTAFQYFTADVVNSLDASYFQYLTTDQITALMNSQYYSSFSASVQATLKSLANNTGVKTVATTSSGNINKVIGWPCLLIAFMMFI